MAVSLPPAHRHRVSIRQAGLVAALVSVGFGRSDLLRARQRDDVTPELRALYQRVLDAVRRRDTTALAPLLADGYLFTDGTTGALVTKRDRLQAVAQGTESIDALHLDSLAVRLDPDAAVASALVRQVGARAGAHHPGHPRHRSVRAHPWTRVAGGRHPHIRRP